MTEGRVACLYAREDDGAFDLPPRIIHAVLDDGSAVPVNYSQLHVRDAVEAHTVHKLIAEIGDAAPLRFRFAISDGKAYPIWEPNEVEAVARWLAWRLFKLMEGDAS
jgi:hypothetical protein